MARRLIGLLVLVQLLVVVVPLLGSELGEKVKVAEGEYSMKFTADYGSLERREVWTLWKAPDGNYEVQSTIHTGERPQLMVVSEFTATLSWELHPLGFREKQTMPGSEEWRVVECEFGQEECRCRVKETEREKEDTVALESPYDLFLPYPWFLSSMVARVTTSKQAARLNAAVMFMDDDPPELAAIQGEVRYLGEEALVVAGGEFLTQRFELRPQPDVVLLVWRSPEGIMVAMQDGKRPEQRMELVRYEKYVDFGPGK